MTLPQINHNTLGAIFRGTSYMANEGVAIHSFRGIPYARIPARFVGAQLVGKYEEGIVNAIRYGYVYSLVLIRIETTDLSSLYFAVHDVHRYPSTYVIYCGFQRKLRYN